ncbi:MAG: radical SAM protein [Bacteroidota bacterium]|nr:radical SAM protein [Bacteroidota bacterium]
MSNFPGHRTDGRWIRSMRGEKSPVDPFLPHGWFNEQEPGQDGKVKEVSAILLTNRECPYTCLMCDLWKHTISETVPAGAIPAQVEYALERLKSSSSLKLFNSGSFFDPRAIPVEDYAKVASLASAFDVVLVESHTAFVGDKCLEFSRMLPGQLQVAIGLETVHPEILPALNKGMSLEDFKKSVGFLKENGISTRAFILLRPPFLSEVEGVEWACRSIDFAFACGVDVCSVIPVRSGNGALDSLAVEAYFQEPSILSLEQVLAYGIALKKGLVFADLWDLDRFSTCESCKVSRKKRLQQMNLAQEILPGINCSCSG